jgi:hypothetical protein
MGSAMLVCKWGGFRCETFFFFFAAAALCGQTATPAPGGAAMQGQVTVLRTEQGRVTVLDPAQLSPSPAQKQQFDDAAKQLQLRMQQLAENQTGCPVVLTSASLSPYMMLLRANGGGTYDPAAKGGLDLGFRNTSGKEIRSMQLQAEFLAKKSIYDLQADKITMFLTVYGTGDIDTSIEHPRHLSLQSSNHPVALNGVTLKQVVFDDGSTWTARQNKTCGMTPNSLLRVAQ